jgi:hypothetical protein
MPTARQFLAVTQDTPSNSRAAGGAAAGPADADRTLTVPGWWAVLASAGTATAAAPAARPTAATMAATFPGVAPLLSVI